jgi:hypothetical protein
MQGREKEGACDARLQEPLPRNNGKATIERECKNVAVDI